MKLLKWTLAAVAGVAVAAATAGTASAQTRYYPTYPTYPAYPQYPAIVTPSTVQVNPWTGGLDTSGTTVMNSAFDPWRQASMNNGTMRPVNRPLPGGGWETGVEWYNPVTGQWHGQTNQLQPNGLGGVNNQQVIRSAGPRRR